MCGCLHVALWCVHLSICFDVECYVAGAEEIVALKRLKMEKEKEGFPITSLREINTLLKAQHPNIVTVRVGVALTVQFKAHV